MAEEIFEEIASVVLRFHDAIHLEEERTKSPEPHSGWAGTHRQQRNCFTCRLHLYYPLYYSMCAFSNWLCRADRTSVRPNSRLCRESHMRRK